MQQIRRPLRFAALSTGLLILAATTIGPAGTATAGGSIVLLVTDASAGGSCDVGLTCVEECLCDTGQPLGRVCCAEEGQIGVPGVSCSDAGGLAGRFNGPV